MRRNGPRRHQRSLEQLAAWLDTFWWCDCDYHNVASLRCYGCGARPSRRLRHLMTTRTPGAPRNLDERATAA